MHPVWDSALDDYEPPLEPLRKSGRGFATGFFITLALAFLVAVVGFVIYDSGVLDRQPSHSARTPLAITFPTSTATPASAATAVPTATLSPTAASNPTAMPAAIPAAVALVVPTATPTVTLTATPTAIPTPTLAPTITPTPQAPATFTLTPEPAATPNATPTPTMNTLAKAQEYMLELINLERENAGLNPVEMGSNRAAQLHAEASLENCVSSHWGLDGLKPYMRYSLAGGYQSNSENGRGLDYCYTASDRVRKLGDIQDEVEDAIRGWMSSPGHRRNMLNPTHRKVNIGIAWDDYNINAVQHFEGDYVRYDSIPSIADGVLSMSGRLLNDAHIADGDDLGVQIYYDPPPHPLTRGQVSRSYCYSSGVRVASLRPSPQAGWFYTDHSYTATLSSCPNPYDVPPDVPGPESANQANRAWQLAYDSSKNSLEQTMTVPWITASRWKTTSASFNIQADLGKIPSGVYTILVWANLGGEDEPVSEYSIFYGVEPPDTYSR